MDTPQEIEATLFSLAADVSVLDADQVAVLKEAAADAGPAFFQEIVELFHEECHPRLGDIDATAAAKDAHELRNHIHFIAGSAANTGLLRLAELCRRIEVQIDGGTFTAYAEVPALVRYEYERAVSEITKAA